MQENIYILESQAIASQDISIQDSLAIALRNHEHYGQVCSLGLAPIVS